MEKIKEKLNFLSQQQNFLKPNDQFSWYSLTDTIPIEVQSKKKFEFAENSWKWPSNLNIPSIEVTIAPKYFNPEKKYRGQLELVKFAQTPSY